MCEIAEKHGFMKFRTVKPARGWQGLHKSRSWKKGGAGGIWGVLFSQKATWNVFLCASMPM